MGTATGCLSEERSSTLLCSTSRPSVTEIVTEGFSHIAPTSSLETHPAYLSSQPFSNYPVDRDQTCVHNRDLKTLHLHLRQQRTLRLAPNPLNSHQGIAMTPRYPSARLRIEELE